MVYVSEYEDTRALIFDGAVTDANTADVLTSANLDDVRDSWEMALLPRKESEAPALRENAMRYLNIAEEFVEGTPDRRVLDVGSGWGFFLGAAKERGWEAYGIEPLAASSVYARAKFGVSVKTDVLRDDSFPCDFFDLITSFQVFEHLPYPQKDLRLLYRFLRNSGLLIIEVPNFVTWSVRLLGKRHRHFVSDHLNFFSADTLGQMLEQNNFQVLRSWRASRHMSIRHLSTYWIDKYSHTLSRASEWMARMLGVWDRSIDVNVGDIIAVVARKR